MTRLQSTLEQTTQKQWSAGCLIVQDMQERLVREAPLMMETASVEEDDFLVMHAALGAHGSAANQTCGVFAAKCSSSSRCTKM